MLKFKNQHKLMFISKLRSLIVFKTLKSTLETVKKVVKYVKKWLYNMFFFLLKINICVYFANRK